LMDVIILRMIGRNPVGGYDIMASILEEYGVSPSPHAVYPLLDLLEGEGLIEGRRERREKVYSLTAKGKAEIELMKEAYKDI